MKSSQKFMLASLAVGGVIGLVILGYRKVFSEGRNEKEGLKNDMKGESNDKTPVELGKAESESTSSAATGRKEKSDNLEVELILESGSQIRKRFRDLAGMIINGENVDNKNILGIKDFRSTFIRKASIVYMYNEEAMNRIPSDDNEMYDFLREVGLKYQFDKLIKRNQYEHGFRRQGPNTRQSSRKLNGPSRRRTTIKISPVGGGEKTVAPVQETEIH